MARGRVIANTICADKRINELSDDTSRLAFTWLITYSDSAGRTPGDPAVLRSMLFPRREDISIEQMTSYVKEWQEHGLIQWYEAHGDWWISFPQFGRYQVGFDHRHEPESTVPEPPDSDVQCTERVRTAYVQSTAELSRVKKSVGAVHCTAPVRTGTARGKIRWSSSLITEEPEAVAHE